MPITLTLTAMGKGKLSKSQLTIPAGPNGQDTYTWTPSENQLATLRYASDGLLFGQAPPRRKAFSLSSTVAHAAASLPDEAMAIIAKYSAGKWEMADGHNDYLLGTPAAEGQAVRAVSDSGYGSSPGNAMEMIKLDQQGQQRHGSHVAARDADEQGQKEFRACRW